MISGNTLYRNLRSSDHTHVHTHSTDTAPVTDSGNFVTSGGVATALQSLSTTLAPKSSPSFTGSVQIAETLTTTGTTNKVIFQADPLDVGSGVAEYQFKSPDGTKQLQISVFDTGVSSIINMGGNLFLEHAEEGRVYNKWHRDNFGNHSPVILHNVAYNTTYYPSHTHNGVTYNAIATGTYYPSDDRLKHNETPITNALDTIKLLKPVLYDKTDKMYDADFSGDVEDSWVETGLIAQELLKIPELKHSVAVPTDKEALPYKVDYLSTLMYAIQAIKELDAKVDLLLAQ